MIRLFFSPELGVSAGGELVADPVKKTVKKYTPGSDSDYSVVAERISASWAANPDITLAWITQPEFADLCDSFSKNLQQRKSAGSDRPSLTHALRQQNSAMNEGVDAVKIYIKKKYKKEEAMAQFARFGIIKEKGGAYTLPREQSKRLKNLDLMIAAIDKDGFGDEEYGTDFWTGMRKTFAASLADANHNDGTVSNKVSAKNMARVHIEKVMTALRSVLMGHYPETYQSVFREWGWQKQDY